MFHRNKKKNAPLPFLRGSYTFGHKKIAKDSAFGSLKNRENNFFGLGAGRRGREPARTVRANSEHTSQTLYSATPPYAAAANLLVSHVAPFFPKIIENL